jgi:hypothetical protein
MATRTEEYLEKAERCEDLALRAKDAEVKIALMEAARQWRGRADLLAQHAGLDSLLARAEGNERLA